MDATINRDHPQDDLVAQRTAAHGHGDLIERWKMGSRRILRRREGQPAVAAKAAVPAHLISFANYDQVLGADLDDIGADQLVASNAADE